MHIVDWLKRIIFSKNGDDWKARNTEVEAVRDSASQCWDETHNNLASLEARMKAAREHDGS